MAVIRQNSFDSIWANGTVITPQSSGNSGGPAGDSFNGLFAAGSNSVQFWSTLKMHGNQCARITNAGGTSSTFGYDDRSDREWGVSDRIYTRAYFHFEDFHSAVLFIQHARQDDTNASGFSVRLTDTGYLQMYQRNGAAVLGQMLNPLTLNTWYRIEAMFDRNGEWALRCYAGDSYNPASPEISGAGAITNMTKGFEFIRWGTEATAALSLTAYVDDVAYSSTWLGPLATASASPIYVDSNPYDWTSTFNMVEALGDLSNTTYVESPELTTTHRECRWKLGALGVGDIRIEVILAGDLNPQARVRLREYSGGTWVTIGTWTSSVSNVPTTYTYTLTTAQMALITDRANLYIEISGAD